MHPTFARSGFELVVSSGGTDRRRSARRAARPAADFASEVPQADKDGTRKNMLRAEVLDAERYPQIALRSAAVSRVVAGAADHRTHHDP